MKRRTVRRTYKMVKQNSKKSVNRVEAKPQREDECCILLKEDEIQIIDALLAEKEGAIKQKINTTKNFRDIFLPLPYLKKIEMIRHKIRTQRRGL